MNTTKLTPKKSSGRSPVLNSAEFNEVEAFITPSSETRQMPYLEVANFHFQHLGVRENLIRQEMEKKGYSRRIVPRKPPLSPEYMVGRYEFVKNNMSWMIGYVGNKDSGLCDIQ